VAHVSADFALQFQRLFLSGFGEFPLKGIFLPTITSLFPETMVAFSLGLGSAFPSLVKSDRMSLMLLTPWTVSLYFFGNIHYIHDQLWIKEATHVLILFPFYSLIHYPTLLLNYEVSAAIRRLTISWRINITLK
jgi:hypothetical protein